MVAIYGLVFLVKFLALDKVISGPRAKNAGPRAAYLWPSVARPTFLATACYLSSSPEDVSTFALQSPKAFCLCSSAVVQLLAPFTQPSKVLSDFQ